MKNKFIYILKKSEKINVKTMKQLSYLFLLFWSFSFYGQKIDENILVNQSFSRIQKHIDAQQIYENGVPVGRNDSLYTYYLNVYLKKAKITKNHEEMLLTYLKLSTISKEEAILKNYNDSINAVFSQVQPSKRIMYAYSFRAQDLLNSQNHYELAIEDYSKTVYLAKQLGDEDQIYLTKLYIANLHQEVGEYKKAMDIIEEVLAAHKEKNFSWMEIYYPELAATFIHNNKLDSAKIFIEKGIKEGGVQKIQYMDLVMYSGVYHFLNGNYDQSIDSLQKVKSNYQHKAYLQQDKLLSIDLYPDYYIGKSIYKKTGNVEAAIPYFKNVDSIMQSYKDADYTVMDTYDHLVGYYKSKGDSKNQLKYLEHQIELDSYLDKKYRTVVNNINRKYNIEEVKKEKDALIDDLKEDNSSFFNLIVGLLILASSLGIMIYIQVKRSKESQSLLDLKDEKLNEYKNINEIQKVALEKEKEVAKKLKIQKMIEAKKREKEEAKKEDKKDFEISEKLVEEILEKLEKFEASKKFINKKYTLSSLAKELNTNSSYLSKIINAEKKLNFSTYINRLRIEYAIQKLEEDKVFRSFTIKAIAEEVGFKTAQSFSATFFKYKGVYPSAFIKTIEQEKTEIDS
ncbi:helix-turn-helix domain-containing protein [Aureivirga sp. CE67]|uniref:helix-turn-helix domain-containing protein n=1 Tax=Aureivirga sp. CE67 TaxID=1788983 RepID=UPI0018C93A87|nr:helix-turn-helix domain-containing protein [Aureivirga sp. CE67]